MYSIAPANSNVTLKARPAYDYHPSWQLVMVGGYDGVSDLDAFKISDDDGTMFTSRASLPETMVSHCLAIMDEERIMAVGGYTSQEKAYMYHRQNK